MHLQPLGSSNDDHQSGLESCLSAFDVEEFLRSQVGAEAGFRYHVVAEGHGHLCGQHAAAAVGDVGEGSAVYEGGRILRCLHQVRVALKNMCCKTKSRLKIWKSQVFFVLLSLSLINVIIIMKELKSLLSSLDANSTDKDKQVENVFENLANRLLNDYHIAKGDEEYYFVNIEFYFCNNNHLDVITYPRAVDGGKWFFHPSGIDLTFKSRFTPYNGDKMLVDTSHDFFFGGILVRDVLRKGDREFFNGPYKCEWELFDIFDAITPSICDIPRVVRNRMTLGLETSSAVRHFSYDEEKMERKLKELREKVFIGDIALTDKDFFSFIKEKKYAYSIDREELMLKLSDQ